MIFEKVRHIVSQQFHVAEEEIELDTVFTEDLDADSLDLVELVMELEDEFETEVDDSEIEDIETVEDAVNYIKNNIGESI